MGTKTKKEEEKIAGKSRELQKSSGGSLGPVLSHFVPGPSRDFQGWESFVANTSMDPIFKMEETIGLTVTRINSSTKTGTFRTLANQRAWSTAISTIVIAVSIVCLVITEPICD